MPPILSIVGVSDSGKTTLIVKLVPELKRRGYRIGTIKHDAHGFEIDYEGKDTYRHFHAGADAVAISSSAKMALIKRLEEPLSLYEIVDRFLGEMDLVITEGFKRMDAPKIEMYRSVLNDGPICTDEDNRIAVVGDVRVPVDVPQFDLDDVQGVADFIERRFLKRMS